jgi:asparagine synthase (glutamine-hydrolysing)
MSGIGGDELFAGYERYRGALAANSYQRMPGLLRHSLRALIHSLPQWDMAGLWIDRMRRFVDGAALPLPERYQQYLSAFTEPGKAGLFSQDFLNELRMAHVADAELAMHKVEQCQDSLEWILLTDMETYLPDDELRKADRLSMWHSLEVRVPFLDHKLVEFVSSIPSGLKLKGWEKKHILIKSLEGVLPHSILDRRKQGFSIPLDKWLRGPLREFLEMHLSASSLKEIGLFNDVTVRRMLVEHDRGERNFETQLWAILVFVLWFKTYMKGSPSAGKA